MLIVVECWDQVLRLPTSATNDYTSWNTISKNKIIEKFILTYFMLLSCQMRYDELESLGSSAGQLVLESVEIISAI